MKAFRVVFAVLACYLAVVTGCNEQPVEQLATTEGDAVWEDQMMRVDLLNHPTDNGTPCAGLYPPQTGFQTCWAYATVKALRYKDPAHYCSWPTNIDIPGMTIGGFSSIPWSLANVQVGDVVAVGGVANHVVYVTGTGNRSSKSEISIQDANRPDGNPWNDGQILGGTLANVEAQIGATAGPTMWRYTCSVTSSGSCGAEPPTPPVLTTPSNGALLSNFTPAFFWNTSGGGCTYTCEVNDGQNTYSGTGSALYWDGFTATRKGVLHTWRVAAYRDTYGPIWSNQTFTFRTPYPELYIEGSSSVPANTPRYYCAMPEQDYTEYTYKWYKNGVLVSTSECTWMSFSSASTVRLEGWHNGAMRKSVTMNISIGAGGERE